MDGTSRRGAYSFFHRGKPALLMGAVLLAAAIASFMPAPRASAQAPERVLVLADTADGGLDSPEAQDAAALGFAVDVVDDSTWQSLTTHDFQGYRAIVLGDPYCGDAVSVSAAESTVATWTPAVNGNVVLIGTDPDYHHYDGERGQAGARALMKAAIGYATGQSGATGAYISLSCYYSGITPTAVPVLDGFDAGGFAVEGTDCDAPAHIVDPSPAVTGVDDAALSGWFCSTHEGFATYPPDFAPVAMAVGEGDYTAPDGTGGLPYILTRGTATGMSFQCDPIPDVCLSGPGIAVGTAGINYAEVLRDPVFPYAAHAEPGGVVFSGDDSGGVGLRFSTVVDHDSWTTKYYLPGRPTDSTPVVQCTIEVLPSGDPENPAPAPAMVSQDCPSASGPILEEFEQDCTLASPCVPAGEWATGPALNGSSVANNTGEWHAVVDFTSALGAQMPGVLETSFKLVYTPLVVVVPGWQLVAPPPPDFNCDYMTDFVEQLRNGLEVPDRYVECYGYDVRAGIASDAPGLGVKIRSMRAGLPANYPVQIVAHSMGGLVARYWYEHVHGPLLDGPVGSISMLGTPNLGVALAGLAHQQCSGLLKYVTCKPAEWVAGHYGFDLNQPSLQDMSPGKSKGFLHDLNKDFSAPSTPVYRAYVGDDPTFFGGLISGSPDNDCLVSRDSVLGPNATFLQRAVNEPATSHDADMAQCNFLSLINSPTVLQELYDDLAGVTADTSGEGAAAATGTPSSAPGPQTIAYSAGEVSDGTQATETVAVPSGLASANIVTYWTTDETPPILGVTLVRPDGSIVNADDPDVARSVDTAGTAAFNVLANGYEITNPQPGDWRVTVSGASIMRPPEPFVVELSTDSLASASIGLSAGRVVDGQPLAMTAELDDDANPVAVSSIAATLSAADGTTHAIQLHDDGLSGDAAAGDHIFTSSLDTTGMCGSYRVDLRASGTTSEGTVTRAAVDTYDVSVAGDATADPCSTDDDGDGVTDADELNTHQTDPLSADTDDDGLSDGAEINTYGTDPLKGDTDGDGLSDGAEVAAGTDPLSPDTDGEGLGDGAEVNTYHTNPLDQDTDGDRLDDREEVAAYQTNPGVADTDGDGLTDGDEVITYATDPLRIDTDGDACGDGFELGASHTAGGQRDPNDPYDFYDVPAPALLTGYTGQKPDGAVGLNSDVLALLAYVGISSTDPRYTQDLDGNGVQDGLQYDRSGAPPDEPWRSGPPDGGIGLGSDVTAILAQAGDLCS